MKFNYQFEDGNESDSEFLDEGVSTSFIFDRSERDQLRNLRKWLGYMNINHAVTRIRDENGQKKYCVVVYDDEEDSDEVKINQNEDKAKEDSNKKSKKKSKKKSSAVEISE